MHRRPANHYRVVCHQRYILIRQQLELGPLVTDLCIDGMGEIQAKAEFLNCMREHIGAI